MNIRFLSTIGVALFSWALGVYSLGTFVDSTIQCPTLRLSAPNPDSACYVLGTFATSSTIAAIIGGGLLLLAMVLAYRRDSDNDNVSTH